MSIRALTHIAVGITSFELWLLFTSSLAFIFNFDLFEAKFAITSLAFILVLVPEPVWKTSRGNESSWRPFNTSFDADLIAFDLFAGSNFNLLLAAAAEYLIMPKASINDLPKGNANLIPLIVKLSKALWVWAPHKAFWGTLTSPRLSFSILNFIISHFFGKLF